ncbi:hypothetical protein [Mongoliitalea lutea]|uniref:RES domain-containing protein n=1 Tax=Mongoliitalea lutea TaxID=849756 RepID=A0A8J3CTW7_9BACT|nr:hypothetical protein [Mongoliitalea lutea]GHB24501.1 hypothetical protein GCM10008106_01540 [Mongoliitalea lutea]
MKPEIYLPKAVKILSRLDLTRNYEEVIRSVFDHVKNVGTMVVTYNAGKGILRARPMGDGEPRFSTVSDFSFKPQHLNREFQRASTPRRTMFYGSTVREGLKPGEIDTPRLITLAESMPWIRDKTVSGIKKIAYGKWITQEPLELLAIANNKGFHGVNSFSEEVYQAFLNNLNAHSLEYRNAILSFYDYMALEFSKEIKNSLDYQVSAIFSDMMCNHANIDGILYPSFMMEGQGLNIAIKPESMKKLGLFAAGESLIYKNKDQMMVGNSASIVLDRKTMNFEMNEDEKHLDEVLKIIGVKSLDELI